LRDVKQLVESGEFLKIIERPFPLTLIAGFLTNEYLSKPSIQVLDHRAWGLTAEMRGVKENNGF
jgi:hypothetical protein